MKSTIFDYDSSDDEKELNNNISVDSNILYKAGSAVLQHKSVLVEYKAQKNKIPYKSSSHSILLNKFLTRKEYDNEDKNIKSLNSLLNDEPHNQEIYKSESSILIVSNVYKLYNKIKELALAIQNQKADIDTTDWECFKVLAKHLDKTELNDTDSLQEIGKAFGILNQDKKTADEDKTKDFFQKISNKQDTKKDINKLLNLNLDPLLKKEILSAINNPITASDSADNKVSSLFSTHKKFQDKLNIVNKANTLYNQLKDLAIEQNKEGDIDTTDWECFKVLAKHLDKTELNDTDSLQEIGKAFGILNQDKKTADEDKTKDFFQKISNKQERKKTIQDLLKLVDQSTVLLNHEIKAHVISKKQTANFDFGIHILCDEQLSSHEEQFPSLSNQLSNFDSIVNGIIKTLPFFNTSINKEIDAREFLASSLTYQKLLKTLTKFTVLRTHGNEIDTSVQYSETKYWGVKYFKTINTKSALSTGLKRTEEVSGLGNYSNISKMLQQTQEKLQLSNEQLITTFQDILKGKAFHNQNKPHPDAVKILYDITYLLFSCEPNRNPEALISNAMFLELVAKGIYQLSDMAAKMPMAIKYEEGKPGPIEVGRFYHQQFEQAGGRARKNDYGKSALQDKSDKVIEFLHREYNLLCNYFRVPVEENKTTFKNIVKDILFKNVNKTKHKDFNKTNINNTLNSYTLDWSDEKCIDHFQLLTFNQGNSFKDIENSFNKKKDGGTKEVHEFFSEKIRKIFDDHINKIEALVKQWYLPDFKFATNDEGLDNNNDYYEDSHGNSNKDIDDSYSWKDFNQYYSVTITKSVDNNDISNITNFSCKKLDYTECVKIENIIKLRVAEEQSIAEFYSPKRIGQKPHAILDCFMNNFLPKIWKGYDDKNIQSYHLLYCLGNSESEVIDNILKHSKLPLNKTKSMQRYDCRYPDPCKSVLNPFILTHSDDMDKSEEKFQNVGLFRDKSQAQNSRESKALKYWQDKYKHNNDDTNIKNLLAASAKHQDTLINILKGEVKIQDSVTSAKAFIIQYLDKVSRVNVLQHLTNKFLNKHNSIELREQLLSKIAYHAESVNNLKLQPDNQHQDATEFLEPLYSNAFGMYKVITNITCKNQGEVDQYCKKPQIEEESTAIIQLEINKNNKFSQLFASLNKTENMIGVNKVEFKKIGGDDKEVVKIDAVKTTEIVIPKNRQEICFTIKRFHYDRVLNKSDKINDHIEFDQIKVNEQDYEITSFIRHSGILSNGHYTTYTKENDKKWYCYNDATRTEVNSTDLSEAQKEAYVIKYSIKNDNTLLPNKQEGIKNDTGARCWLNASVIFTKSFTTLQEELQQFIQENQFIFEDDELLKCIAPQTPQMYLTIQENTYQVESNKQNAQSNSKTMDVEEQAITPNHEFPEMDDVDYNFDRILNLNDQKQVINIQSHNFDYDNHQPALLGQDYNETI